LLKSKYRF